MLGPQRSARVRISVCGLALTAALVTGCAGAQGIAATSQGSELESPPSPGPITTEPARSTTPPPPTPDDDTRAATLTLNKGLALPSGTVVQSTDPTASITLIRNQNGLNSASFYVPGGHILLPTSPDYSEAELQQAQPIYAAGLVPGYVFVLQTRGGARYALRIDRFANQDRDAVYWRMDVRWQRL